MLPYRRDSHELAQWLASVDALVHAGTKETFGLVLLEAMACGRPVVAARAGAVPEIVDDSVGMLAKPSDGESMAEAIAVALRARHRSGGRRGARPRAEAVHLDAGVHGAGECVHEPRRRAPHSCAGACRRSSWDRRLLVANRPRRSARRSPSARK